MKKAKRSYMLLLAVALVLTAALSACSGTKQKASAGGGSTAASAAAEKSGGSDGSKGKPTEISIMNHFFSPTPPLDNNPVKKEIEMLTNTKLNIQWISPNNYRDKFNVTLASGELPDLMLVGDPFDPVFRSAAEKGAFWDVGPYIKD